MLKVGLQIRVSSATNARFCASEIHLFPSDNIHRRQVAFAADNFNQIKVATGKIQSLAPEIQTLSQMVWHRQLNLS